MQVIIVQTVCVVRSPVAVATDLALQGDVYVIAVTEVQLVQLTEGVRF